MQRIMMQPWARRYRWALWLLALLGVLVVVIEISARLFWGLGDPPLYIAIEGIEYLPRPSSEYRRFGNRIRYNAYSMRSDHFSAQRGSDNEVRILVVGDSIINGGAATDQADLATERMRELLATQLGRPIVVGNISAGSWGPPNMLAYLEHFGWFDADLVIFVLSSHDSADVPTGEPVVDAHPAYPSKAPLFAISELMGRYIPRLLGDRHSDPTGPPSVDSAAEEQALAALNRMIQLAHSQGIRIVVAQHLVREELANGPFRGHGLIAEVARNNGIEPVQLGPGFAEALSNGTEVYRDGVHPNREGQRVIADVLVSAVMSLWSDHSRGK